MDWAGVWCDPGGWGVASEGVSGRRWGGGGVQTDADSEGVVAFAARQIDKKYNYNGAVTVTQNNKPVNGLINWAGDNHERSDYYCSQLVACAFKSVGKKLTTTIEQDPTDLADLVKGKKAEAVGCLYDRGVYNGV